MQTTAALAEAGQVDTVRRDIATQRARRDTIQSEIRTIGLDLGVLNGTSYTAGSPHITACASLLASLHPSHSIDGHEDITGS